MSFKERIAPIWLIGEKICFVFCARQFLRSMALLCVQNMFFKIDMDLLVIVALCYRKCWLKQTACCLRITITIKQTNKQTKHHNSLLSENNLDQKYHPRSVGTAAEGIYPNLLSTELVLSLCIYFQEKRNLQEPFFFYSVTHLRHSFQSKQFPVEQDQCPLRKKSEKGSRKK